MANFLDVLFSSEPVQTVRDGVQAQSSSAAQQLLQSSEFGVVLDKVQERAREAVVVETKKNAVTLLTLAVAGGAVGGALFRGPLGFVAGCGLAYWSVRRIAGGSEPAPAPGAPTSSTQSARLRGLGNYGYDRVR